MANKKKVELNKVTFKKWLELKQQSGCGGGRILFIYLFLTLILEVKVFIFSDLIILCINFA